MSAEARLQEQIADAVRRETAPLKKAVEALSARLAAVEGSGGAPAATPAKRAAGGRTAKAQPAEAKGAPDDGSAGTSSAPAGDGEKTAPAKAADK